MKRGPKPQTPAVKASRGTLRHDRDGPVSGVQIMAAGDPPVTPDYLTPEAQDVWVEEIGRVMASGVAEIDSTLFARYCSVEALARKAFAAGEPPPSSYLTELRRMGELLGIGGPRSRVGMKSGGAPSDNPFARNGKRA